ncbi:hypothetical protein GQ54DRAFT_295259 [Martensiomyces pterosporus]|nr:hypothetical protein GQ54DRAFT_295259 [Martensiomyces pterosporus]
MRAADVPTSAPSTACPPVDELPQPRATLLTPDGGVLATRVHYETLNDAVFLAKATLLSSAVCLLSFILLSLASANVDIKLGVLAITSYPKLLFSSSVWSSTSVFAAIQVVWFLAYCLFSHIIRLHFNATDPPRDWDDRNGEWSVVELDVRANAKPSSPAASEAQRRANSAYNVLRQRHSADSHRPAPPVVGSPAAQPSVVTEFIAEPHNSSVNLVWPNSLRHPPSIPLPSTILGECYESEAALRTFRSASDEWKLCVQPTADTTATGMLAAISLLTPDPDYIAWKARRKQKEGH